MRSAKTRELLMAFAEAARTGARDDLKPILDEDVVYLASGGSVDRPPERGRDEVIVALTAPTQPGVEVTTCLLTELLVAGDRGIVILLFRGTDAAGHGFATEIAFHVACHNERVIAITEYAGDQRCVDDLTQGDP